MTRYEFYNFVNNFLKFIKLLLKFDSFVTRLVVVMRSITTDI